MRIVVFSRLSRPINMNSIYYMSTFLRASYPAFVINCFGFRRENVAKATSRGANIIFMELFQVLVFTRAFSTRIVIIVSAPAPPIKVAFSTRIIIQFTYRLTSPNSQLRWPLYGHSAYESAMLFLVLSHWATMLFSVLFMYQRFPLTNSRYHSNGKRRRRRKGSSWYWSRS